MIINKVINNNVLSTHDENNREIVLMGKGIGFQKKVGDEVAEDKIEKRFVLDSEDEVGKFSELIEMIPHNYLNLSVDIISYAQQVMPKRLSPSIYISLTDHINFLLERSTKGELFENPLFTSLWITITFFLICLSSISLILGSGLLSLIKINLFLFKSVFL